MVELKSGWRRVTLGDVALNSTEVSNAPRDEGFERYIIGKHLPMDGYRVTTWNDVGDGEFGPRIRTIFRPGDVICTTRGPNLRVVTVDFKGLCAHTNFVLRSLDPNVLVQPYLEAIVRSDGFQQHLRTNFRGSVNLFVNWSDAAKYEFVLPPVEEQQRIVEPLRAGTVLKERIQIARDAARQAYRAALTALFTRKARAPGVEPEHWATMGWPLFRLETLVEPDAPISYGIVQVRDSVEGGVPTATSNSLNVGFRTGIHFTSPEIEAAYARSRIRGNDVLVTVKGFGTGKIAVVPEFFVGNINRDVARIRIADATDSRFFVHLWKSPAFTRYWRAVSVGTTRPELSIGKLRAMNVPWPTRDMRRRLVHDLDSMERAYLALTDRHIQAQTVLTSLSCWTLPAGREGTS